MSKYGLLAVLIAVVYCMSCCDSYEVIINATDSSQFWQGTSEVKVIKTNEIKNDYNFHHHEMKNDENIQQRPHVRPKNKIRRKSGKKKTKRGMRRNSKKIRRGRRDKKQGKSEVKVIKTTTIKNYENILRHHHEKNQRHHHVRSKNKKKRHLPGKIKTKRGKRRNSRKLRRVRRDIKPVIRRRAHVGRGELRIKRHQRKPGLRNNYTEEPSFKTFKPYAIASQLKELAKFFPDENITQEIIGRTAEYNDIVLLKIKYARPLNKTTYFRTRENVFVDEVPERKILFIVHGLTLMGFGKLPCLSQPREFMTLLDYYTQYSHVFDIFVIPMANPDGVAAINYEYWNKNMSPQKDCPGVSLDRNFDVAWKGSRRGNTCSQQYPGPFPFSELETQAIRNVLHRYGHKIVGYFHVHGGMFSEDIFRGDAVLYPKGYTEVQSDDDIYIDLKGEIDEALKNQSFHFLSVAVETLHNWYGPVAGTSVDYASTVYGIPYAMEFTMQIYQNSGNFWDENALKETDVALNYLWQPVIYVIFQKIYDEYSLNDVDKPN